MALRIFTGNENELKKNLDRDKEGSIRERKK